ncbi:MAG: hypothetical protein AAF434_01970 [Pseudomonadota bacterium]
MADNEIKHYAELMAELMRLYREKRTGSLFFITPDNRMAQINFDAGTIVFIYYRGKRGQEALRLMPEILQARVIFEDEPEAAIRTPLPSTPKIIGYLTEAEAAERVMPSTARKSVADLRTARDVIEAALIGNVGPIGGMLCEEVFRQNLPLENTIQALSEHIPNKRNAQRFRATMQSRLSAHASA